MDPAEVKLIIDGALKIYELERQNRELITNLQNESLKKQEILNVFKKYVPEHIIQEILASGSETPIIGGETEL